LKQAVAVEKGDPDEEGAKQAANDPASEALFGLRTGKLHGD
jgi:hypothetical protein